MSLSCEHAAEEQTSHHSLCVRTDAGAGKSSEARHAPLCPCLGVDGRTGTVAAFLCFWNAACCHYTTTLYLRVAVLYEHSARCSDSWFRYASEILAAKASCVLASSSRMSRPVSRPGIKGRQHATSNRPIRVSDVHPGLSSSIRPPKR
jgi:hypothetical protein